MKTFWRIAAASMFLWSMAFASDSESAVCFSHHGPSDKPFPDICFSPGGSLRSSAPLTIALDTNVLAVRRALSAAIMSTYDSTSCETGNTTFSYVSLDSSKIELCRKDIDVLITKLLEEMPDHPELNALAKRLQTN